VVIPTPGSYFVLHYSETDSTGNVVLSDTEWETIKATDLTQNGKDGVVEIIISGQAPDGSFDTSISYRKYETNGDLSMYYTEKGGLFPAGWYTYPFATQASFSGTHDTLFQGETLHEAYTIAGSGSGSITIKGTSFTTQKITITSTVTRNGITTPYSIRIFEFAPSLGEIVKYEFPGQHVEYNPNRLNNSDHMSAFDYSLH